MEAGRRPEALRGCLSRASGDEEVTLGELEEACSRHSRRQSSPGAALLSDLHLHSGRTGSRGGFPNREALGSRAFWGDGQGNSVEREWKGADGGRSWGGTVTAGQLGAEEGSGQCGGRRDGEKGAAVTVTTTRGRHSAWGRVGEGWSRGDVQGLVGLGDTCGGSVSKPAGAQGEAGAGPGLGVGVTWGATLLSGARPRVPGQPPWAEPRPTSCQVADHPRGW